MYSIVNTVLLGYQWKSDSMICGVIKSLWQSRESQSTEALL